jgi:2-aminoadipate transaminase
VAYEVGHGGFLDRHIKLIRKVYSERRDIMLAAMDTYFPPGVDWTQPQGGLFLWGIMPSEIDASQLLKEAVEHKVAFVPGEPFHPVGGGTNTMRLNFSNATPDNIREGIMRLAKLLREKTGELVAVR